MFLANQAEITTCEDSWPRCAASLKGHEEKRRGHRGLHHGFGEHWRGREVSVASMPAPLNQERSLGVPAWRELPKEKETISFDC